MLRARLNGFDAAIRDLEREVTASLPPVVERAAQDIALRAKATHPYTDRTGNLTRSIEPLPAVAAPDGTVRGGVVAGEEYASYVEEKGFAFMEPAAREVEPTMEADAARTLTDAAARAGWRSQ